jgi:hypothetical protein
MLRRLPAYFVLGKSILDGTEIGLENKKMPTQYPVDMFESVTEVGV